MIKYFIVALLAFITAPLSAQSYNLKYDFDEGKTYVYKEISENEITQEMMGQQMKMNNDARMLVRLTVDNNTGEKLSFVISYDSVVSRTKTPQIDTTISNEQVLNKRTRISIDSKGNIISREVLDSIDMSDPMNQVGRRDPITFGKLPEQEIKTGDTWTVTDVDSMDMMGGTTIMTSEVEYTLSGKEEKLGYSVLKIPFKSKISIEGRGNMMGFEFVMEGSGNATGDLYFSAEEGIPVLTETTQAFDVTMAGTGNQNMIIPISQVVKTTRSLVK